jgi:hypothetical protein
LGAAANYSKVFELSRGMYFKWAAHDDLCMPNYLTKCVEVLDSDPSVVLCHSYVKSVDKFGNEIKLWPSRPELGSESPHRRFRDNLNRVDTFPIWGVMRRDVLKLTPLLGNYADHDRPLLAEVSLHGRFFEVPEYLFLDREHEDRYIRRYEASDPHNAIIWYHPDNAGKLTFPAWRLLREYIQCIFRSPIAWMDKISCYYELINWVRSREEEFSRDLIHATGYIPGIGQWVHRIQERILNASWRRKIEDAVRRLDSRLSLRAKVIVIDEAKFDPEVYEKCHKFLRKRYERVINDNCLVMFDLRSKILNSRSLTKKNK